MSKVKDVVPVIKKHIQMGIEKYNGVTDEHLKTLLMNAGFDYEVYRFQDDRIMLVFPTRHVAVLYRNEEVLLSKLNLT